MKNTAVVVKGIVHGNTVELDQPSGFPEGAAVSVTLQPALQPGDGLRQAFGGWADDAQELDAFVEQVYRDRADDR
jgi:hypothetical protein